MPQSTLYSIGHGNKKIAVFINELKSFEIEYLVDVRSKPYSRWHPHFNQSTLKAYLEENGITYVFAGDTLGGRPEDKSYYGPDGKVDYELLKETDLFKQGLERLMTAHEKNIRLAIMCSESKPEDCHRSRLIGRELLKQKISIEHIISENETRSQENVKGSANLFSSEHIRL